MELQAYLRILRKRGWIILLVAILAGASAFGFSKFQTPLYKASIKLSVEPARLDWGLSNTLKDILRNYVLRLGTHTMAQKVINRAQLDMNSYAFLEKIEVSSDASNFSIQIDAKDPDPQVAMLIAQTTAQIFVEEREAWNQEQDKRDRIVVTIVDDVRDAPLFRPKPLINALAGLFLGALVGGVIVFFLEWLEAGTLRTSEDVERVTGVTVLGAIPVEGIARGQRRGILRRA